MNRKPISDAMREALRKAGYVQIESPPDADWLTFERADGRRYLYRRDKSVCVRPRERTRETPKPEPDHDERMREPKYARRFLTAGAPAFRYTCSHEHMGSLNFAIGQRSRGLQK